MCKVSCLRQWNVIILFQKRIKLNYSAIKYKQYYYIGLWFNWRKNSVFWSYANNSNRRQRWNFSLFFSFFYQVKYRYILDSTTIHSHILIEDANCQVPHYLLFLKYINLLSVILNNNFQFTIQTLICLI